MKIQQTISIFVKGKEIARSNNFRLDPLLLDIDNHCFFSRKEVKQMFHNITHGYDIIFNINPAANAIIRKPRQLRAFFQITKHARFNYCLQSRN